MPNPRVKFRVSKSKDRDTVNAFIKEAAFFGGRNLEWAFYSKYPELKNILMHPRALSQFVNEQYKESDRLEKRLTQHEQRWQAVSATFFSLVDRLFAQRPWPKGKYIAYGTLWGMYPRFLDDKTFQIPFAHHNLRYVTVVIAHEMLHFMFYDYFFGRFPKYKAQKYASFAWHVSEIFNTVVQNSPAWTRVFREQSMGYPEHEPIVKSLAKQYAKGAFIDVDALTDAIMTAVRALPSAAHSPS